MRQGVAEAECRRAADAAEAAYRGAFDRGLPAEEARLDAEHARCLALAASAFAAVAVGEPAVREVRRRAQGSPRRPCVGPGASWGAGRAGACSAAPVGQGRSQRRRGCLHWAA